MEWHVHRPSADRVRALARALELPRPMAACLAARGLDETASAQTFLNPKLQDLPDPFLLPDLETAVTAILETLAAERPLAVYGDYDADGLTAAALLTDFLRGLGGDVRPYVPHRLREGYGLNVPAVEALAREGVKLLVTVDCGVTDHEAVRRAGELGVEVVITDHHRPPDRLPAARAVVNAKRPGSRFPQSDLAGVGVAFFLAGGIRKVAREKGLYPPERQPELVRYLGLVALGTVADVVPLTRVNRVLVSEGLKHLTRTDWPGLAALKEASALDPGQPVTARDVAFRLAPRLNATGRLDAPDTALNLLLADNPDQARPLAQRLEALNRERKTMQEQTIRQAREMMEDLDEAGRKFILLAHEDWHRGVVGIAASKLVDIYRRPVILLALENGVARGSGRSLAGFNLFEALQSCEDLLDRFGGHDMAAGLGLGADRLPDLAAALEEIASASLADETLTPKLDIEAVVSDEELTPDLAAHLARLGPFGFGNAEPTLAVPGLAVLSCGIVGRNHLRLRLRGGSRSLEAIGFGLGGLMPDLGPTVNVALRPMASYYRGVLSHGWQVVDVKSDQDWPAQD